MRGAIAVLIGFLEVAVMSTLTDAVMHGTGVFPPFGEPMAGGLFVLALAYRTVFTVLGGWLTATLAPDRRYARILAALGTVGGGLGVVAWAAGGPEMGPLWYPVALLVLAAPSVLAGAALARRP